jgi:hypothetical protein
MGPDEHPSREELSMIVRLMFAKFEHQAAIISTLAGLLIAKGVITDGELKKSLERLPDSEAALRVNEALKKLGDFATIHSTARQYLDRLEE